jgi:hypothetical protein
MCCHSVNRRDFMGIAGAMAMPLAATAAAPWPADFWNPDRPLVTASKTLAVQPVLMYSTPQRKPETSWKSWGGVQTEETADAECTRITEELKRLVAHAGFPMDVKPVIKVKTMEAAAEASRSTADVTVLYPATGSGKMMQAILPEKGEAILFIRHRSGPISYWYEALSHRQLRTDPQAKREASDPRRLSVDDVVVDDGAELLWRLRALYAAKNLIGTRIVALGGAQGKYDGDAPGVARSRYKLNIIESGYPDMERRLQSAFANSATVARSREWAERYLRLPHTSLETDRKFVENAFLLYGVFRDLMQENDATAFTINQCMGTIMPMAKTTACLTLQLMNDEGLLAFCESDFVAIPAGILLRYVSGKPVFLHNSTFPHNGMVTCAHCTGPRRMDGKHYDPARIVTHYESDYGAAPKVEIPKGQDVSFIDPDYATGRWVSFRGTVEENPFFPICRSQQDVRIHGDWRKLLKEVRDSHWVMAYGDHIREIGYAAPRVGINLDVIS